VPKDVPQPSIERVRLPVGVDVPVSEATVMVTTSFVLVFGVKVAALTDVVVPMRVVVAAGGHAVTRALRLSEPRPVTRS
jgi:hypothetical protein